jgi:hypothetical protein
LTARVIKPSLLFFAPPAREREVVAFLEEAPFEREDVLAEAERAALACLDFVGSDCLEEVRTVPPELVFFDPPVLLDAVEFGFADREAFALEFFAALPDDLDEELPFDAVRELADVVFVFVAIRSYTPCVGTPDHATGPTIIVYSKPHYLYCRRLKYVPHGTQIKHSVRQNCT